jgi:hypothetical protein
MPSLKVWIKNRLERFLVTPFCMASEIVQQPPESSRRLQIVIPHRSNWALTTACVGAFERLTTGEFGITVVVNFDSVPEDWVGWKDPSVTLICNRLTPLGRVLRRFHAAENGSMNNALAIDVALRANPHLEWALVAHNDSAPMTKGWNEFFFAALGDGLVIGNTRDQARVFAAHSAGALFSAAEFRRRNGSPWPTFRFGNMILDVGDGMTETLHPKENGLVPVLPNTRQSPELARKLEKRFPVLYEFALNGTHVSFDAASETPIFAHLGRGTPRSKGDLSLSHKLPVDIWIDLVNAL